MSDEAIFVEYAAKHLPYNGVILQIGAGDGILTDPVSPLLKIRPDLKLIAIEPIPFLFEELKANYQDNDNVVCLNVAISDTEGIADMTYVIDNPGNPDWSRGLATLGEIRNLARSFPCDIISVKTIRLESLSLPPIDCLVVDVEGHELEVLNQFFDQVRSEPSLIYYEHQCLYGRFNKFIYEDIPLVCNTICIRKQIPKIFHRVWLGGKEMPLNFQRFGDTWINHHPDWTMKLWREEDLLSENFINQDLIDSSRIVAQKADIARYEILAKYGGVYLDTDFECLRNIEDILHNTFCFSASEKEGVEFIKSHISIGIMGCYKNDPIFNACVEQVRGSINKSSHILDQTGPHFFARICNQFPGQIRIFGRRLFYPEWGKLEGAYGLHHWANSWHEQAFNKE